MGFVPSGIWKDYLGGAMTTWTIRKCPECDKAPLRIGSPDGKRLLGSQHEKGELYYPRCIKIVAPVLETRVRRK